eukprot:1160211-Pelagomonas_calceolata.AAC.6
MRRQQQITVAMISFTQEAHHGGEALQSCIASIHPSTSSCIFITDVQDRRALNASSLRLQQLQNKIRGIPVTAEPHINVAARIVDSLARNSRKDTIQVLGSALIRAFSVSCDVDKKLRDLATQCNSKSPKQRALEATMARLGRLIDDEAVQQELPQQQQQQQQEQDPEEGQGVRLPMARMDTSDACPAAESAAQAQRTLALQVGHTM